MIAFLKKLLIQLTILAVVVVIFGVCYQLNATWRDRASYPPPGEFVTVGDQEIHLLCRGERSAELPVVILESGRGSSSITWFDVIDRVAPTQQVCAYDRPGMGWSAPDNIYRSPEEITENLYAILQSADIAPPYLLVGHSIGGIIVRDFYHQYPNTVAGMVLVDSAFDNEYAPDDQHITADMVFYTAGAPAGTAASWVGLPRLYRLYRAIENPPTANKEIEIARRNETHYIASNFTETRAALLMISREEPIQSLGDLPLRVLEQTVTSQPAYGNHMGHISLWHDYQVTLAGLSTNSELIEAPLSGHNIPEEDPDLVADNITSLLKTLESTKVSTLNPQP